MFNPDEPCREALPVVVVIDDNQAIREALRDLFESAGLRVTAFSVAPASPEFAQLATANCVVLDVRLPGTSGLELQQQLASAGIETPVVLMSGHADIFMSVEAMKAGAYDFLAKPFHAQEMLDAVLAAISDDLGRRLAAQRSAGVKARFAQLSSREREVMSLVTDGLLNKQVAGWLGVSEVTIKIHRKQVMTKMGVRTLPDLVRCALALDLLGNEPSAKASRADWSEGAFHSTERKHPNLRSAWRLA
jgi:FixJ family two-component response regulator